MGFIRKILMCLLVLAVPAQGSATVTMAFCGPSHHGAGQAPDAGHASKAERGTEHAVHGAPGEYGDHGHLKAGPDLGAAVSDDGVPHAKFVHAEKHKCSACSSCCSAAAILSAMPLIAAPSAASASFDSVVPTVSAFAADGPDRPPRPVLA